VPLNGFTIPVPPTGLLLEAGGVTLLAVLLVLLLLGLETLLALVVLELGVPTLAFGLETLLAFVLGTLLAPLGLETLLAVVVTPVGAAWLGACRLLVVGWLEGGLAGVVVLTVEPARHFAQCNNTKKPLYCLQHLGGDDSS
jgi:hypothetical protein